MFPKVHIFMLYSSVSSFCKGTEKVESIWVLLGCVNFLMRHSNTERPFGVSLGLQLKYTGVIDGKRR